MIGVYVGMWLWYHTISCHSDDQDYDEDDNEDNADYDDNQW